VDRIAARARSNKRMLYHYFGNKEALFTRVLEDAYREFRAAEAALNIEADDPVTALTRLMHFTWDYYLANPEFITLVNSENLHKARHLKASETIATVNRSFVARMSGLLARGAAAGVFRPDLDAVQVLIALAGLGFHYLNNRYTGEIVYGRPMMSEQALAQRGAFNVAALLRIVCTPEALRRLEGSG
jgi:AcrR family transcriptional regulator